MLAQGTAQMVEGRVFNRKKKCDNVSRTKMFETVMLRLLP